MKGKGKKLNSNDKNILKTTPETVNDITMESQIPI